MEAARPRLDIVLPCYNPPDGWEQAVADALTGLRVALPDTELQLLIVNDGSQKGYTKASAARLQAAVGHEGLRFLAHSPNRGKGFALREGVEASKADFIIYTDIDFPYEQESLLRVFERLRSGEADVVAGVRDQGYYVDVPPMRRRISRFLRWMMRNMLRLRVTDTQCGLKGFNRKGRALFLRTRIKRFLFDLEFIYLASGGGDLKLEACPVNLRPGVVFSRMNYRILLNESANFFWIFMRGLGRGMRGKNR